MLTRTQFLTKNEALTHPRFRNYLLYRFAIIMALNMQATIIAYYTYEITHDKLALGMIGLWEVIPAIGFSLFSGHFVDLQEKRNLLLKCFGLYVLLSVFFVFLTWHSVGEVLSVRGITWLIYGGIFAGGALRAFLSPASFALMGMLVPRNLYPNATTWSSVAWQSGAVMGPLLGGFMIALGGFSISIGITALLQLVGMVAVARIPRQEILNKTREPVLKSLGEGLKFVFNTQIVLAALSLDMFAVLFGGAVALLPVFSDDLLFVGELGYGWLRAAPGIGSIISLAVLSFIPLKKSPGNKLLFCIAAFGITTIIFGYSVAFGIQAVFYIGNFPVSYGFMVAFAMLLAGGVFDAVSVVIRGTILQVYTPDNMRGRVAAVNTMFISSSNELGALESGVTAKMMGTIPAVVFGGCMTLVVVAVTWFKAPSLRTMTLNNDKNDNMS